MYNPRWWRVYRNDNIFRMDWVIHGHMGNVLVNHVSYMCHVRVIWVMYVSTIPCYFHGPLSPRLAIPMVDQYLYHLTHV